MVFVSVRMRNYCVVYIQRRIWWLIFIELGWSKPSNISGGIPEDEIRLVPCTKSLQRSEYLDAAENSQLMVDTLCMFIVLILS